MFRLPLCYLMDSILQNVRGQYIPLFSRYAVAMCCRTYEEGSARDRQCVAKLLRIWRERKIFPNTVLDAIDTQVARIEKRAANGGGATAPATAAAPGAGPGDSVGEKR